MERLKEGMLQLTKGWDRAQVERLVQDVMLEVIDPFVYQEALDLIAQHQAAGRRITSCRPRRRRSCGRSHDTSASQV